VPYAGYVPKRWKKYNWREWVDVIAANVKGAVIHAQALVNQYLEKWK
jgi:NADP-dependent 3-hydroxy acid dehydrogenase YdfG